MVIKSQNLQGFKATHQHRTFWFAGLKRRVVNHDCAIVLLQETHVSSQLEADSLQRQWCAAMGVPYDETEPISFWSIGTKRAGGVAVLINPFILRGFSAAHGSYWSDHFIAIRSHDLQVLCLYAPTNAPQRRRFFERLADIDIGTIPTIAGGDFNCVLDPVNDRFSTVAALRSTSECPQLGTLLSRWDLVDALHQRRQFGHTLEDRQSFRRTYHTHNSRNGSARLDRIYLSRSLAGWVGLVRTAPPQNTSDHQEVAVVLQPPDCVTAGLKLKCVYRPQSQRHGRFLERLQPRLSRLVAKFLRVPHADFNFDRFIAQCHVAITKTKVELCEQRNRRLHAAQRRRRAKVNSQGSPSRLDTILLNVKSNRARRLRQAGQAMDSGAAGTAAKFKRVAAREWDQSVTALQSSEVRFEAADSIADRFRKAWTPLYQAHLTDSAAFPIHVPETRQLSVAAACEMVSAITLPEISSVLQQLRKNKRAGPDELPNEFFQDSADILAPVLQRVCQAALTTGRCPPSFSEALIFPIRKNGDSVDPMQYRPISLLNCSYKILAKVLANRVVRVLDQLVCTQQNGYVPSRRMEDSINIMLAAMQLSDVNAALEPAESPVVILLDFSKAYDSLDRNYLFEVLHRFGFPERFTDLVRGMHHSTTARFLANGHRSAKFEIQRGIRQGCPLAPYLFILAMDPLATRFHERSEDWGLRFGEGGAYTHHVFSGFVDDSALFLRRADLVPVALDVLRSFAFASGLRVNASKSHAIFLHTSPGFSLRHWEQIPILPVGETTRYLGVQIGVQDLSAANWAFRLASFSRRLAIIARRRHTLVDRAMLASSILSPAVLFTALFFWPSPSILQQLDDMIYHFLWSGFFSSDQASRWPIAADILRLPRKFGGIQAPNFLRDITVQAAKKVLRWASLSPSIERTVGALLLRPESSIRATPHSLELLRPCYLPILQHRRVHHWPKSVLATVWSIGEGELAIASGLPGTCPTTLAASRASWWSRLKSLGCVRKVHVDHNTVTMQFDVPIWLSSAWEEFCALSERVIPRQVSRFWTRLNIVGNPWYRTRSGDTVPWGHYGLHGDVTISDLMHITRVDNRFTCTLTPAGSDIVLQRHTHHGRTQILHQWFLLFLLNCPAGITEAPLALYPAVPPYTGWHVRLSESASNMVTLSSSMVIWHAPLPRINGPLHHPSIHPLTQCQARWLQVARCAPAQIEPHPSIYRAALVWPGSDSACSVKVFARYLTVSIKSRFHSRGLAALTKRLESWRKRDTDLALLLDQETWTSIWSATMPISPEDRLFRYKFRLGALNTYRTTADLTPNCPLSHCARDEPDDLLHVFWRCGLAQTLWSRVLSMWHRRPVSTPLSKHAQQRILSELNPFVPVWLWSAPGIGSGGHKLLRQMTRFLWILLVRSFMRTIWRARNEEVHNDAVRRPDAVFLTGIAEFSYRIDALLAVYSARGDIARLVVLRAIASPWTDYKDHEWLAPVYASPPIAWPDILLFDGGSRGNPGPGAGGAVHLIRQADSWNIYWYGIAVCSDATTTNNVAEYTGLLLGLRHIVKRSVRNLVVIGDSQLVLSQLQGHAQVSAPALEPFFLAAMRLLDNIEIISFRHHKRAHNKMADHLTNLGMDTKTSRTSTLPHMADAPTVSQLQAFLLNDLAPLTPDVDSAPSTASPSSDSVPPLHDPGPFYPASS